MPIFFLTISLLLNISLAASLFFIFKKKSSTPKQGNDDISLLRSESNFEAATPETPPISDHSSKTSDELNETSELAEVRKHSEFQASIQQFFSDVSISMMSAEDYPGKLNYFLKKTCKFLASSHVTLLRVSNSKKSWVIEQTYTDHAGATPIDPEVCVKLGPAYNTLLEKPYIVSEEAGYFCEFRPDDDPESYAEKASCMLGVKIGGNLYGALYFDFNKEHRSWFNNFNNFLNTLQAILVFTVENKIITRNLEKGNQRMTSIFNVSDAVIFYTDNSGHIIDTNGRFLVTENKIGSLVFDALKDEKFAAFATNYKTVFSDKISCHFTEESASGKIYMIDLYPVFDSLNQVTGISNFIFDITDERKKTEELHLNQKVLTAMLKSMPVSLWVLNSDFSPVLFEGNVISEKMLDVSKMPDDDLLKQNIYRALLGWPSSFTYSYNSTYINHYISPFTDESGDINGVIGVSVDVTEIKAMEVKVSSLNDRLNIAIDASKAGVWEIIPGQDKLICNDNTYTLLGLDPASSSLDVPKFLQGMLENRTCEQLFDLDAKENTLLETKLTWADGSVHYVSNYIRSAEDTRIYGISIDNTAQGLLSIQLIEAKNRAEIANEAKSEFLSKMSHEIRTPMNAIIGMTSLAKRTDDLSRIQGYLDKIADSNEHLLNIINDILDMSKIESGKLQLFEQEFSIETVLKNAVNIMSVKIKEKRQKLTVELDPLLPFKFYGDDMRLSQVVLNLLSNANKFTPIHGNISVAVNLDELDGDEAVVRFAVTDNGIGLDKNKIEAIFKPFEQADGSVTRKFGGTGLGLSICKKIVELMGGDISVESEPETGSRFIFTVRLKVLSELLTPDIHITFKSEQIRILAVDDSEDVLDYITDVLNTHNLTCDTAANGYEAINKTKQSLEEGRPYNIIYMDYKMPGLTGLEATKEIYRLTDSKCVIIMISSYNMDDIKKNAKNDGVFKFIEKPLFPSAILRVITDLIDGGDTPEPPKDISAAYDFTGRTILLAEDVPINAEIVGELLSPTNIAIDVACDGAEAVKLYKENPDKYDLIFMDVQMPTMDGYEATGQIRESGFETSRDIPIIAMTANVFKEDYEKEISYGMTGHINKPIDEAEMLKTLSVYFSKAETKPPAAASEQTLAAKPTVLPENVVVTPQKTDISKLDLTGIDINEGLKRINSNLKLYAILLKSFIEDEHYEKLLSSISENDDKSAAMAAHSLKGLASNLGLTLLLDAAAEIESLIKRNAFTENSHEFEHFKRCYEITMESVNKALSHITGTL